MMRACLLLILAAWAALGAGPADAETLVIPFIAHNARGRDGSLWSSEIYLTNPTLQPVQVSVLDFLPGTIDRSRPCDVPTAPTRVVPPLSSVVWTASGLATDLGCADRAVGSLVLDADGTVLVTSRTVNHPPGTDHGVQGLLTGAGQETEAIPVSQLPAAGDHVLPSLLWHRNSCGPAEFDTYIGFANQSDQPVGVQIDVPGSAADGGVLVDDVAVRLPHDLRIPARSWVQIHLEPTDDPSAQCLGPSSFMAFVSTDAPIAFYASVVSRSSSDPRTVLPQPLD
jgi:hypothetical protein